ncbi:MAG: long-chain fatty acid--CoA ligase [Bacteroidetes bacterium]|nr:long-chain fatty acid--CoA ligase [Bacteroidota bacterium]
MTNAPPFTTIIEMYHSVTSRFSREQRPFLMHKVDGAYRGTTFSDYRRQVERFAGGLASLGIVRGDRIAIVSENRPEWVVADMAIVGLGTVSVPVYPTLTPKQLEFIFKDAGITAVIISNPFQLGKVSKIREEVRSLKHVILMTEPAHDQPHTLGWSHVSDLGDAYERQHPGFFQESAGRVKPDDVLTVIYTSGTTGNPKGVMLSHRNMVSNVVASSSVIPFGPSDTFLSFLPLCHSFERMAGYYTAMSLGATIAYAESIDTVRDNLVEIHPTIVTTVPRLFERIHSRLMKQIDSAPAPRQKIFHWAVAVGKEYARARRRERLTAGLRFRHSLADKLVYSKLRERTGGRIRFFVSGGAALPRELGEFFEAVGIKIIEGYGLTETSPVLTVNRLDDYRFGTVGKTIPGVEIKIADDGEILAKGPNVMLGYYNNPRATAEVIDKDGWFHTGDIGMFDGEGHLMITDRKKHLFVSSGGKNIAPQPIENLFLQSKYIDQFVLVGDGRMFCTALIVPDFDNVKEFTTSNGIPETSEDALIANIDVRKLFQGEIDRLQKDLPHYERVRRFELLAAPLTVEAGEVTPTLKVKRRAVEQRYSYLIEKMYEGTS